MCGCLEFAFIVREFTFFFFVPSNYFFVFSAWSFCLWLLLRGYNLRHTHSFPDCQECLDMILNLAPLSLLRQSIVHSVFGQRLFSSPLCHKAPALVDWSVCRLRRVKKGLHEAAGKALQRSNCWLASYALSLSRLYQSYGMTFEPHRPQWHAVTNQ